MNKSRIIKGRFTKRLGGDRFNGFAVYQDAKGYKCIWINGKDVKVHVFVWEQINGSKPDGYEIHHIDHDKGNYDIENLELLSKSDHRRIHAGWIKTDGEWSHKPCTGCGKILSLDNFYPRKGYTPSAKCKPCHCKQAFEWNKNNIEKRREIGLNYYYRNKRQEEK